MHKPIGRSAAIGVCVCDTEHTLRRPHQPLRRVRRTHVYKYVYSPKKAENNKQIDIQNRWTDCVDRQNDKLIKVYINMVQA